MKRNSQCTIVPGNQFTKLILVCFILLLAVFSQSAAQQYRKFDVNNGLTQNTVSSIVQDQTGRLWIGTGNGINCYDGYDILRVFSSGSISQPLPGNRIRSLYVDSQNRVWLGTSTGIGRVNQSTRKAEKVNTNKPLPETSILFESQGKLIVLSGQEGICAVDIKSGIVSTLYPRKQPFAGILSWTRMGEDVVISWNEEWLVKVNKEGEVRKWKKLPPSMEVVGFAVRGSKLFLLTNQGLIKSEGETFRKIQLPASFDGNLKFGIFQSENVLLLALERKGLYTYNLETGEDENAYTVATGDPDFQHVKCMLVDPYDNIWVGTDGSGLIKLNQQRRRFYPLTRKINGHSEPVPYFTRHVLEDAAHRIVLGTLQNGISVIDKSNGDEKLIKLINGTEVNPQIYCMELLDEKGGLIAGTKNGMFYVDLNVGSAHVLVKDHKVSSICRLNDTLLVVSFADNAELRLYKFKSGKLTYDGRVLDSLTLGLSKIVLNKKRKELLLFGSSYGLIKVPLYELLTTSGNQLKIKLDPVRINDAIFFENGDLILASADGLLLVDSNLELKKELNRASGLPDDYINVLVPDKGGFFWATTNLGIVKVKNDLSFFRSFNRSNGIHELEFNTGTPARFKNGEVAMGTVAGVVMFNPSGQLDKEPPAFPRLAQLLVNGHRREIDNSNEPVVFSYQEHTLQISVFSTDFTTPENNLFSFILEGGGQEWTIPSNNRTIAFQHLDPGKYVLKARCINSIGEWGASVPIFSFEITPPVWGTSWFRILAALVLLIIIGVVSAFAFSYRLRRALARERRAKQIENIRSGISRNIHDEIGAGLSRIALMSSLAKRTKDESRLKDYHEKLLQTSHELTKNLSEIVWAVNPRHDNLKSLVFYIRDFIYETLEDTGISAEVRMPESLPELTLTPDFRNHLFLTIKESLNNVIKHSEASRFEFLLQMKGKVLYVEMTDNGKGFSKEAMREFGNGLNNMLYRMTEIGADYKIDSMPGNGTTITIEVSL